MFFLDEAHLLFDDASEAFLESITQTVRLIRSKGVGVFFVTQTPKDVPAKGPDEMRDAAPGRRGRAEEQPSMAERVVESGVFTSLARSVGTQIGREITRSLFGTARRSGRRRR